MTSLMNTQNFIYNQPIIYSTLIALLVILPIFLSMFFLMGKYIQNKFGILARNQYATLPMGFIIFLLITFIVYVPLIILRLSGPSIGIVYVATECLKDLSIFVFLWLNKDLVKFKFKWKTILSFAFIIAFLISIPIFIFFASNKHANPLQFHIVADIHKAFYGGTIEKSPWLFEKIYNSWFMWNSTIWYITSVNEEFALWILQPTIIVTILLTTVTSFFRILLKKIRSFGWVGILLISSSVMTLTYSKYGDFAPTIGIVTTTLILILVSWETFKTPKVRNFVLLGIAGMAILAFNWSALWIYTSYMVVLIGLYVYKEKPKPTLLILFTIVFVGFIFSASMHSYFIINLKNQGQIDALKNANKDNIRSIGSTIGMILSVLVGFVLLWLRNKNIEVPLDKFLFKFRKWWIPLAFAVLTIVSIIIWSTSSKQSKWFNFGVDDSFLGSLSYVPHLSKIMYVLYWILLFASIVVLLLNIKSKKRLEIDTFLILVGFVTTIFFFSPFTASLIKIYLAPKSIFIDMQWVSVCPIAIGFILKGIKLSRIIYRKIQSRNKRIWYV